MNKIHYILLSLVALLFTACTSDDYIGTEENGTVISLGGATGILTRAGSATTGAEAAALLGNKFIVYGTKVKADGTTIDPVFPGYNVIYANGTAYTTTSNTAGWEYVGKGNSDTQTIKYWDYGAKSYSFAAYSLGKDATDDDYDNVTASVSSDWSLESLELSGTKADLLSCYLTHKQKVEPSSMGSHQVQLQFFTLGSKVRLGIYENLSGYSVKDVKFYDGEVTTGVNTPYLYSDNNLAYNGGKYTITYDGTSGKVQTATDFTSYTTDATKYLEFGSLTDYATAESGEGGGTIYIGRASNLCTLTPYLQILPHTIGANLNLKVDYTLVSTDGKQTIQVYGATAVVPASYADWKPNTAYTYIFKINNTNATLQPITFDAYAVVDETGATQGTITTYGTYSITTHQEGDVDGDNVSYVTGKSIEVMTILGDGSSLTTIDLAAQSLSTTKDYVIIYHQESPYETDIEKVTSTSTTPVDGVYLETIDKIIGGKAYFNPDKTGTYRVEYWHRESSTATPERRAVKIVLVGDKSGTPSTNGAFTGQDLENTDVE